MKRTSTVFSGLASSVLLFGAIAIAGNPPGHGGQGASLLVPGHGPTLGHGSDPGHGIGPSVSVGADATAIAMLKPLDDRDPKKINWPNAGPSDESSAADAIVKELLKEGIKFAKDEALKTVKSMFTSYESVDWWVSDDRKTAIVVLHLSHERNTKTRISINVEDWVFDQNLDHDQKAHFAFHNVKKELLPMLQTMIKEDKEKLRDQDRADKNFGHGDTVSIATPTNSSRGYYLVDRFEGMTREAFFKANPDAYVVITVTSDTPLKR